MKTTFAVISGSLMSLALAAPVAAQDAVQTVSAEAYIKYLESIAANIPAAGAVSKPVVGRGTTLGVPGAFTLPHGTFFASGSLSNKRRNPGSPIGDSTDASAAFGVGFGDASRTVGFDIVLGLDSVDPKDFGDSGTVSFKLSRQVASFQTGQSAAVAVGVGSAVRWGDSKASKENTYLAYTSTFAFEAADRFVPGLFTIGYGTQVGANDRGRGLFASAGVGVTDWLSVGAGVSKDEYHIGGNVHRKFGEYDGSISLSYADSTKSGVNNGRWNLSVAVATPKFF
ncbi:hypothetical protein [Falsigemmobacter faecalis]|uniref:Transporter n=1 Tax=Falsigemmobacter faecalis TaxID=2488730 RepID=A0A3P3DXR4_9RHOB|nr:hypothetical protein [Falsigemmobacter faecalis]RRH78232.1 hypothetical protein EG244_01960 [Falsigemmobacter faecalis]